MSDSDLSPIWQVYPCLSKDQISDSDLSLAVKFSQGLFADEIKFIDSVCELVWNKGIKAFWKLSLFTASIAAQLTKTGAGNLINNCSSIGCDMQLAIVLGDTFLTYCQ